MSRHAIRTGAVAIATGLVLALGASAALGGGTQIPVSDGVGHPGKTLQVKPFQIIWTGDATGVFAGRGTASKRPKLGRLHWSKWTVSEGRATGANWLNDCVPFCAAGKFTPFNVNLTVYRPRVLSGFKVFTRIKVVYTGKVPHSYKRTGVFTLDHQGKSCSGGSLFSGARTRLSSELGGEVAIRHDHHVVELEPSRNQPELAAQLARHEIPVDALLGERPLHEQDPCWRSDFRSTRATSSSPSRNGST